LGKKSIAIIFVFFIAFLGAALTFYTASNIFHLQQQSSSIVGNQQQLQMILGRANPRTAIVSSALSQPPLVSICSNLVLNSAQSIQPQFSGRPSSLVFSCGKSGNLPAFLSLFTGKGKSLSVTPIFTIPTGWTLSVGKSRLTGECTSTDQMVALSSGSSVTLHPLTAYVYCLTTPSASSFTTFSVSWSQ
jgi:hypothetical protein